MVNPERIKNSFRFFLIQSNFRIPEWQRREYQPQEFVRHRHQPNQDSTICDSGPDGSPLLPVRVEKWHRFVHPQVVQGWRRVLSLSTQSLGAQKSEAHFSHARG